jgi:pimeloyl-ACP methyl ester carboxylesterase
VIERLQARGVQVTAVANPLRGMSIDSAYVASVFEQIPGPVLALGHSYGGAVITNAAAGTSNVVGLVYVAAFAPDVPVDQTAVMAATQRPVSELAFTEPSGAPAWKMLPSWVVIAKGSHVIMISQPQAVTEVIEVAIAKVP